jgi:lipopolysaccharide biosynthesis glycosyltransferase
VLKIFIGYDKRETVAYHVLCQSILSRASQPVSITPINLDNLNGVFYRKREKQSTDFAFSRFLVPYLSDYEGYSLFMDCDMLVRFDISMLFGYVSDLYDVSVVKHDYIPTTATKFLGQEQTIYPCKNWSSVMLFNNANCKMLTKDYVNKASGADLHQFRWTDKIGSLPSRYNHLVGEYPENPNADIVHFTLGTPCFKGYEEQEYAGEWRKEKEAMLHAD